MIASRWLTLAVAAVFAAPPSRAAELSKYLPDDTEIVMGVQVTKLMEAPLVRKHLPAIVKKYGPDVVKFGAEASGQKLDDNILKAITTGLSDADAIRKFLDDNKTRVERITFATTSNEADERVFLVIEGDLNREKIAAFLGAAKLFGVDLKTEKAGKHDIYVVKVPGEDEEMFFALVDDRTIVAATQKEDVVKALGRAEKKETAVRKELRELAGNVDEKAVFWFVAAPKETDEYVTAVGTVFVTDGVRLTTAITTKDADAAKDLADDVKKGLKDATEALEDFAKDFKPLGAVLNILKKVTPEVEKNAVKVTVELPAETIEKMVKDLRDER
jgi:hypothetical protein